MMTDYSNIEEKVSEKLNFVEEYGKEEQIKLI